MNVYDFDNTIYDGDSSKDFYKFCIKMNKKCLFIIPKFMFISCLYMIKIVNKEKLKSNYFSFLKYFNNIDEVVEKFWKLNKTKIKKFYIDNKHKNDIIISASPEFLLKPISKIYGFKLVATKVDKKTGKLLDNNCYGEEKVKKIEEHHIKKIENFYSDSLSDTPLSKISNNSFIVKGDKIIKWENYKLTFFKKIIKTFLDRDFFTFLFIGVINVFNGVVLALFYSKFIENKILAFIIGFICSLTIAYILNSILNFKSKLSIKKYLMFALNNIPNFIIQVLTVIILLNKLNCSKFWSYLISSTIAVPITFVLVKINVFKKRI